MFKKIFKISLIVLMCTLTFLGTAYMYLGYNFKKSTAAEQKDFKVPYRQTPQGEGILFVFPSKRAMLMFLDFEAMGIDILNVDASENGTDNYGGYTVDYTVDMDYLVIEGVIDRIGGLNLMLDDTPVRYTGTQLVDLINAGCSNELRTQIITQVFKQISKNNFSKEDFIFILQNSKTDLSVIDCIAWVPYIEEMCGKIQFIGE